METTDGRVYIHDRHQAKFKAIQSKGKCKLFSHFSLHSPEPQTTELSGDSTLNIKDVWIGLLTKREK